MVQLRDVAGDAKQPAVQCFTLAQLSNVVPSPQERLLSQILTDLTIMTHGTHEQINPLVVTIYEFLGRRPVALPEPCRQLRRLLSQQSAVLVGGSLVPG